jgi:hypothetical protein
VALRLLTAWGFIFGGVGVAGFSIARSTLDLIEALISLSLATIVITGAGSIALRKRRLRSFTGRQHEFCGKNLNNLAEDYSECWLVTTQKSYPELVLPCSLPRALHELPRPYSSPSDHSHIDVLGAKRVGRSLSPYICNRRGHSKIVQRKRRTLNADKSNRQTLELPSRVLIDPISLDSICLSFSRLTRHRKQLMFQI